MAKRGDTRPTRRRRGRASRARPLARVLAIVVLLAAVVAVTLWQWSRWSLTWQVRQGLTLLEGADTPAKTLAALAVWEDRTRDNWVERADELVTLLYSEYSLSDRRVRLMLTRISGSDYGDRLEDWQRWHATRRRISQGLQPLVSRREAVTLVPRWKSPIGLTAWFSTILPLDGYIYVASLGTGLDSPGDQADGVVRVNGVDGTSELFFAPPPEHRGPRDVIGLAADEEGLFVAGHNGSVYAIGFDGSARWHMHVGDQIVAPPLAVDTNLDGVTDVVVVTRAGKAVALSGHSGRTSWVTTLAAPAADASLLGTTLCLGAVSDVAARELVVTLPTGDVSLLAVRDGRLLWGRLLAAGTVAGAVCTGLDNEQSDAVSSPAAYVADSVGDVWALVGVPDDVAIVGWQSLAIRHDETLVASPRLIGPGPDQPALLIACPTGHYSGNRGAVCVASAEGIVWRLAVGGAIWGTPAVADLNGDRRPEVVVTSIEPRGDEDVGGALSIISSAGHCLRRVAFDAALESSPVVADVDGDGYLEILVADQAGWLHCYATERYGPVLWGSAGGDSHNTRHPANAFSYGQVPAGYQRQWRPAP